MVLYTRKHKTATVNGVLVGRVSPQKNDVVEITDSVPRLSPVMQVLHCMEVVLEQKDAADWVYRGEGAANLVLAYTGSSPAFAGKVLRLQKAQRNTADVTKTECVNGESVLTKHERLVWRDNKELVSSSSKELLEQLYVQHIMRPLLGPKHVETGMRVLVSREFLESVQKNVICKRPAWRVDAAEVDTHSNSVLLMSDHTLFPHGMFKGEPCIAVEIKISGLSEYDPLDLFSGSKERICKAIKALYNTPQNNFRVFLNGSLIFGGLGGGTSSTSVVTGKAFEDALKCIIQADDGLRTNSFIQLVAETVYHAGVLDRLLQVQKLDSFDIEAVIHAYYNVISQPCKICKELDEDKVSQLCTSLHSISLDESLKIVKNYLIAATAKDCSLMICFRPRGDEVSGASYNSVHLESTNQVFDYKASFIDLDLKPLRKIEEYYELDKKIASCYKMVNPENEVNKAGIMNNNENTFFASSSGCWKKANWCLRLRNPLSVKTILSVELPCTKCRQKVMKLIAKVEGVTSIVIDTSKNSVTVIGEADPVKIIKKVREFRRSAKIVSIGPPKEEKKDIIAVTPQTCQRCDVWYVVAEDYYGYCSIL
ncbi:hypothetical protein EZV62_021356 [Acer yangbiense]|uniref:Inositol-pentakisphosphate 2-kinase n=1 Tax=Acer yangbiense TaxID=1000413 RepID=A0A5C7H5I3_9ROSI|nr:hypothetical protein EZV62_021356 [Acer yangbiense]